MSTVELPIKGHFGATCSCFVPCREAVLFSEVESVLSPYKSILHVGDMESVLCNDVVPFLEGPLTEVPCTVLLTCLLVILSSQ